MPLRAAPVRLGILLSILTLVVTWAPLLPGPGKDGFISLVEWSDRRAMPPPSKPKVVDLIVHRQEGPSVLTQLLEGASAGNFIVRWPYRPTFEIPLGVLLRSLIVLGMLGAMALGLLRSGEQRRLLIRRHWAFLVGIPVLFLGMAFAHFPSYPCPTCRDEVDYRYIDLDDRCTRCLGMKHVGWWNLQNSEVVERKWYWNRCVF